MQTLPVTRHPTRAARVRHAPSRLSCFALATAAPSLAQSLTPATPESVGLSSERLERLHQTMKAYTDQGRIAGVVTLIVRNGHVAEFQAFGALDREKQAPMQKDAIFRIASKSKAVTSVAVLMLLEEGQAPAERPGVEVHPVVQEHARSLVPPPPGAPGDAPIGDRPAKREITIRDLLTHTAGISYGGGPRGARSTRPRASRRGTSPTRTRPIGALDRAAGRRCRSTRSPARSSSTATTPTSSAPWSRRRRACRSTSSSARGSSSR